MKIDRSRLGRWFGALSGPPEDTLSARVAHHGARVLVLIALAFAARTLFPVSPVPDVPVLETGMVAEDDVIAEVGYPIYKPDAVLSTERAEAAAAVAPIFDYRPAADDSVLADIDAFFVRVDSVIAAAPDTGTRAANQAAEREALRRLLTSQEFGVADAAIEVLRSADSRGVLERSIRAAVREELPPGVVTTSELEEVVTSQIRLRRGGEVEFVPVDSLRTAPDFYARSARHLPADPGTEMAELQRLILIRFFEPSITFDSEATAAARERARQAVPVVQERVLEGERIVGAHEPIGPEEIQRLQAYREYLITIGATDSGFGWRGVGAFLISLLILSIGGALLSLFRREVYEDFRHILLLGFLTLALLAAAAIIGGAGAPMELIPIAIPVLVVAVLWNGRMALELGLVLAILLALQPGLLGPSSLFTLALAASVSALSVRVFRRRAQTWIVSSIIAGAYVGSAIALGLLRVQSVEFVAEAAAWGSVNAFVSALIAMGALPLFESWTNITTDQKLLELSDLDHPLLQRLRREAPGTFAHSINVANLAEAAAQAVGANPLLARVGLYYHDIGKIPKPQYFIENQPTGRNPHDKLKPAMSAAIVRNHVIEGLRLADEHNLPGAIRDVIAEHHGTQLISFFYDRAREAANGEALDPADFQYPGPKPQSQETAIAMLADSVESAARVLPDPDPGRIRDLIRRITEGKIERHQLDDAPLTLRELQKIENEFARILGGMYHQRIDYPPAPDAAETEPAPVGAGSRPHGRG